MSESKPEADPLTALMQGAAMMHEMYVSLQNAGFTKNEALAIVIAQMINGMNNPQQ